MFLIVTPLCKLLLWRVNREIRPTWNATTATKMFCLCRDKPLALYIFSNDKSKVQRMMDSTSSGGFLANDTLVHAGGESFSILQGRGGSSVFEPLVRGGSFNFQQPRGGGPSCFITGTWTRLTQSRTEVTPSSSREQKTFRVVAWKSTLGWCTVEMAVSCIVKSVRELRSVKEWTRNHREAIFQILRLS